MFLTKSLLIGMKSEHTSSLTLLLLLRLLAGDVNPAIIILSIANGRGLNGNAGENRAIAR